MTAAGEERTPDPRIEQANALRITLVMHLAKSTAPGRGQCAECKESVDYELLEVDHVDGRLWSARALSSFQRVVRYWNELFAGVRLRALCRSCNGRDGAIRQAYGERRTIKIRGRR